MTVIFVSIGQKTYCIGPILPKVNHFMHLTSQLIATVISKATKVDDG
jgi:hypothetical protein